MQFCAAALLLAGSSVCAQISLEQAITAVECWRRAGSEAVLRVHPEGPLNILLGHAAVNNDAIAKKRMFSPPIQTAYMLEDVSDDGSYRAFDECDREYRYSREPEDDTIGKFTCSEKMDYLHAYYNTLKVLFKITNNKVGVETHCGDSFSNCVRLGFGSVGERARFFAALLLLASGERIGARYEEEAAPEEGLLPLKAPSISLVYGGTALLELNSKIGCLEEVRTVVEFFANCAAAGVEKFDLHHTDSPSFLVQAYLCAYADSSAFIGEVFECVDALLAEIHSGPELDAARGRYFTADDKLLGAYSEQYDACREIDAIDSSVSAHAPFDFPLDAETRSFLTACIKETSNNSTPLLACLIRDSANRLLSKVDEVLLPNAHIVEVESASDPMALYDALTRWLAYAPLHSEQDLMAAVDQLLPTFVRLLSREDGLDGATAESSGASDSPLSANSPLVLLIANILGSVSPDNFRTRYGFFQIVLANCVGRCAEFFPNIRIDPLLSCKESDTDLRFYYERRLWAKTDNRVPNYALSHLRKLAVGETVWSDYKQEYIAPITRHIGRFGDTGRVVHLVLDMFMKCKHTEGVEFLRSYAVPDESSGTLNGRIDRARWFRVAIAHRLYSEARWVCESWSDFQFAQFSDGRGWNHSFTVRRLPALSDRTIARIFPDGATPASFRALLGLYAKLASSLSDYDGICSAIKGNTDKLDPTFVAEVCRMSLSGVLPKRRKSSLSHTTGGNGTMMEMLGLERLKNLTSEVRELCNTKFGSGDECEEIFRCCEQKLAEYEELY